METTKKPWTPGRIRSFIVSVLRAGTRRWPAKYECLNDAKTEKKVNINSGRLAQHYLCALCEAEFTSKDIEVDHITPIIDPEIGFVSWDSFIKNLFCSKEHLQALCKECHTVKTKKERSKGRKHDKIFNTSRLSD
jgi:5-methylcytosine-specific restriction endonuclease McrA